MKYKSVDIDILVVVALTIIALALAFLLPPSWVPGRILTLPLVMVLPGYALTSALFSRQVLGIPEYLLFSLGLSLTIVILGGLALNLTPFGLRANSWAVFLSTITLSASAVALVRRRGQSSIFSTFSIFSIVSEWSRVRGIVLTFRQGLLLGLAVLIVWGAVAVSIIGAERQPHQGFTQLWILPAGRAANAKNVVRLGMSNMESKSMQYRLTVNMDGKVVKEWSSIDLSPNEKWQTTLVLPQTMHTTGTLKVEAMLYLTDAPTKVYRNVVLWIGT